MSALTEPPARRAVHAPQGVVATSQPLAASAGLFMLREGGTAADAAIAMAAALTVVEPTSCSIGSDVMGIIAAPEGIHGIIGAGRAPAALDVESALRAISPRGWHTVTVPAAPRAWADIHARYGRLPFGRLLEPAVTYARGGFPLSPVVAAQWRALAGGKHLPEGEPFAAFAETFLPRGFEPVPGARFANPDLAATLERVGATGAEDFYNGDTAKHMAHFAEATGGWLRTGDLAAHSTEWVEPLSVPFRGRRVYELPPPTQGGVALLALGLLDRVGPQSDPVLAEHLAVEAIKHAFAMSLPVVADGAEPRAWLRAVLNTSVLADEAGALGDIAAPGTQDARLDAGTVYMAAADANGMMVSLIQSSFMDFGSHVVVPGTGIALANRGWCFSRRRHHPNAPHGGRRPYNTIIPGLVSDGIGRPLGPFGVMGGYMQPQGHVQVLRRLLDDGLDPQAALDAPRWRFIGGRDVECEDGFDRALETALARRGHHMQRQRSHAPFGRGQIIQRSGRDWVAGSDNRGDGCALGY